MRATTAGGDAAPLTEATFCILLSLAPGPKHGYAIMKEVRYVSDRRVTLSTGTLYGALKRLLDQGWIARVDGAPDDVPERAAKTYTLTDHGRQVLAAETARLEGLLRMARERVAGEPA